MNNPDAAGSDRTAIMRTTADLLATVNASDADRCSPLWADDGVLMPPHHPSVQGHQAIVEYFRSLFSRSRFKLLERVTYTATIWPGGDASPIEDMGKGLHVYGRQPDGSWKLTQDIWNSDQSVPC